MRVSLVVVLALTCLPRVARALPCDADDGLARAAAELLLDGEAPSVEALAEALVRAGSDLTAVRSLRVAPEEEAPVERWIAALRSRSDAPLVCGEATDGEVRLVLAAFRGGGLVPVAGHPDRLRPVLAEGFGAPHLVVQGADGALVRLPVDDEALRGGVRLPEELPRPLLVQLVASGPSGPRPVAERWVGAPDVPTPREGYSTAGDGDLPRRVADLRAHHGVSELRPNRLLDAEASRHARRVCTAGRALHALDEGDPEERLRRRGIEARVVGETVARARTAPEALSALADSPSHRLTLIDRRFTDAGYGAARDRRGHACVVVLLAAWPRVVGR